MSSTTSEKSLCAATATYFSSQGYYVSRNLEVQGLKPVDIVCIMPRLSDLKKRVQSKHFVSPAILHILINRDWMSTEEIVEETGFDFSFVSSALKDMYRDEWISKKLENEKFYWRNKGYRVPSKDCIIAHCRYRNSMDFLETLSNYDGCYNKIYVVFPFPVDEKFIDLCTEKGVGILLFYEKGGYFKELLPPEIQEVTNLKVYASISEIIIKENFMYRSIDSI
ncbi:MAG: hypothetical protein ACUVXA_04115 [Candidatus Jordarchaeum sp.]|uniref:hypothetical protein n=1 Tax=Candidatus Jordarchaeum sp. TaxID=2823881 RepID=UPI0040499944